MNTVEIAIGDDKGNQTGTETVRARPTPIPGLTITGSRGDYRITHVSSGHRVCCATMRGLDSSIRGRPRSLLIRL